MNEHISSARRSDDQLLAILDQPADWTVNGRAGCVLSVAYTLRDAIRGVFDHEASGKHVFAVCRQPGNEIILFREQVERVAVADGIITNRRGWPAALSHSGLARSSPTRLSGSKVCARQPNEKGSYGRRHHLCGL
jgi:hypothetical protein